MPTPRLRSPWGRVGFGVGFGDRLTAIGRGGAEHLGQWCVAAADELLEQGGKFLGSPCTVETRYTVPRFVSVGVTLRCDGGPCPPYRLCPPCGAVIMRTTGLRMIVETGIHMHSLASKPLILSIFNPKSPLHDGAIVIKDRFIEAARCTLPLSQQLQSDGFIMGMRHRSAIGVTEQSDAIVVVVSEETGIISVAEDGKLIRRLAGKELRTFLIERMRPQTKGAFSRLFKMSTAEEAEEV